MKVCAFDEFWVAECRGDNHLPARSHTLYSPPNGCNMGAPREGVEAGAGLKNSFAIAHTSSDLKHLYTIDVAIDMAEELGKKNLKNLEEILEPSSRKSIDQTIHDLNFKNIFV
jgi:hypothetical protein